MLVLKGRTFKICQICTFFLCYGNMPAGNTGSRNGRWCPCPYKADTIGEEGGREGGEIEVIASVETGQTLKRTMK